MKITSLSYLTILTTFVLLGPLIACKPVDTLFSNKQSSEGWHDISETGLPTIEVINLPSFDQSDRLGPLETAQKEPTTEAAVNSINQSIALDKAKLAAAYSDKCPKLINTPIGTTKIVRKNEIMKKSYCDYYIYPKKGQRISIESHPSHIKANLVTPIYYDFDNGSYQVDELDKYVIRLTYEGIEYQDAPTNYDVVISVK